jgi:acyl dehydratase
MNAGSGPASRETLRPGGLRFEDFAVGQRFRSGSVRMERDRITAFAEEFDPQPQHLSERAAASTQFGELVASGWHTASVTMRLFIADALPKIAGGGQGIGIEGLSWLRPVRPGDQLHVEAEVIAARPSRSRPEKGLLKIRTNTLNQRGELVMTAMHTVMLPRKTPAFDSATA